MHSPALEIGGFFGREPQSGRTALEAAHLGAHATRLNSGRNCLRAILDHAHCRRLHLPEYVCQTVVQAVRDAGVEPVFHPLDEHLKPMTTISPASDELWLRINYFGLMDSTVSQATQPADRLIVDNCQAFFAPPVSGAATFYSPRKFFGVPDGGYLVGAASGSWPPDDSNDRHEHMRLRDQQGPRAGFSRHQAHEIMFAKLPIRTMSAQTQAQLAAIDYDAAADRRRQNYQLLNDALGQENSLGLATDFAGDGIPLTYPLLNTCENLRPQLHRRGIFAASYWPDCLTRNACGPQAQHLAQHLTALPIDQRYGPAEMQQIIQAVSEILAGSRAAAVVS